jgi:hypothetical protein
MDLSDLSPAEQADFTTCFGEAWGLVASMVAAAQMHVGGDPSSAERAAALEATFGPKTVGALDLIAREAIAAIADLDRTRDGSYFMSRINVICHRLGLPAEF